MIKNDDKVGATALYGRYKDWARDNGHYQWSQRVFGQKLVARGYEKKRKEHGFVYLGLRLR